MLCIICFKNHTERYNNNICKECSTCGEEYKTILDQTGYDVRYEYDKKIKEVYGNK